MGVKLGHPSAVNQTGLCTGSEFQWTDTVIHST